MSESELQNQLLTYLNLHKDFFAWRNNSTGIYDPSTKTYRRKVGFDIKGVSDILGIHKPTGRLVAIEVKSEKGKPTFEQLAFIKRINESGGISFWVNNFETFVDMIKTIK